MQEKIIVENLKKSYKHLLAVNGLSFTVYSGEIIGLLGPNGAGKSTTINILSTVLKPDSGNVQVAGYDLRSNKKEIKKLLGIVPQDLAIYEEISAEKNVRFFAGLYGASGTKLDAQVKTALEIVGLYNRRKDKAKTFSGGMKRRLNIACGIAHEPDIIIMDEPTVGIDPQSRNHILESITLLRKKGATIIYSTHYMEEVEAIADRVLIMNDGAVIASGTTEEICKSYETQTSYTFTVDSTKNLEENSFAHISNLQQVEIEDAEVHILVNGTGKHLNEIINVFISGDCNVLGMSSKKASLETVFLDLTGKKLRD